MTEGSATNALVLLPGPVDGSPLGSGIRALELARAMSTQARVTLAVPGDAPASLDGMECVRFHPQDPRGLRAALRVADVVLSTPRWPRIMRALSRSDARLIFDLYDPEPLALAPGFPGQRRALRRLLYAYSVDRIADALRIGDQFLCSSERQRDLWLGMMLAERLIDADRYDHDRSLRSLIGVVPFGIPEQPPSSRGAGPRERFDAIDSGDEIVLWNGGLWPWLDAETAIRAIAKLAGDRQVRLVFMGAASYVPAQRAMAAARALARDLGVLDREVLFNDALVPYAERADWLLGADCALSAHDDQLETRFAFRTRLLDCIWSSLPIVCTDGDELAELVEREGLGKVAPVRDPDRLAMAIATVLDRGRTPFEPAFLRVAKRFTWRAVAAPLLRWLSVPPPPRAPGRARSGGERLRRGSYLLGRSALDAIGARDWPRL